MVRSPHGVRLSLLAAVTLLAAGLSWIGLKLWTNSGHLLPPASWAGLPILIAFALGLYLAGRPIARLVSGRATKPVNPLYAARILLLAQAAALSGAVSLGWYAAQILLLLPDADVESLQQRMVTLGALGVGAVLLAAAGLRVQRMCRLDDRPDRRDEDEDDERDSGGH